VNILSPVASMRHFLCSFHSSIFVSQNNNHIHQIIKLVHKNPLSGSNCLTYFWAINKNQIAMLYLGIALGIFLVAVGVAFITESNNTKTI
jgi:hypothetical protein